MRNMKHVIDLTHPINANMPTHPSDAPATLRQTPNDYQLTTGMHTGTHIDGPAHMLESSLKISSFPACYFMGPGVLIDARNKKIDATLFENRVIKPDSIVLVLTGHGKKIGKSGYYEDHPTISKDFAQELIPYKINMLGMDIPSPDNHPFEVHKLLLQKNILIIENLTNLELLLDVPEFTIAALPLKIEADSAPARVIAFY